MTRTLWSIAILLALSSTLSARESGEITGQLLDAKGRATLVGKAGVFLCDAKTGLPIIKSTRRVMEPSNRFEIDEFWTATTDDRGVFKFEEVPVGIYRLLAQSWTGTEGVPRFDGSSGKPSAIVALHGTAENVQVKLNETTRVFVRSLGQETVRFENDPAENHAFLLISRNPTLGDPVLGPLGWGNEFIKGLVGVTLMEKAHLTVIGLPKDVQIHVALFNYDNNPGLGGGVYKIGTKPVFTIPIYATWSNGRYDPPQRLLKLVEYFENGKVRMESLLGIKDQGRAAREQVIDLLKKESQRKIKIDQLGEFKIADIIAANSYQRLRKYHRQRKANK